MTRPRHRYNLGAVVKRHMKRRVAGTRPGSGGFLKYRLLTNLGEIAPVLRSAKGVLHDDHHSGLELALCVTLRRYGSYQATQPALADHSRTRIVAQEARMCFRSVWSNRFLRIIHGFSHRSSHRMAMVRTASPVSRLGRAASDRRSVLSRPTGRSRFFVRSRARLQPRLLATRPPWPDRHRNSGQPGPQRTPLFSSRSSSSISLTGSQAPNPPVKTATAMSMTAKYL